jgi:hypothetical protein
MVDGQIWWGGGGVEGGGVGNFHWLEQILPYPPSPSQNHILIFNQGEYDTEDKKSKIFDNRLNCSCS